MPADISPQASVVLATGVFIKALHQRSNFYAACVYLSQSSANVMVSLINSYPEGLAVSLSYPPPRHTTNGRCAPCVSTDPHKSLPSFYGVCTILAPAPPLRSFTSDRDRTTLRASMVCGHGDVSGHDNLPRRTWGLVFGHVYLPPRWKGLGLDWRGSGGISGATATCKPTTVPYTTGGVIGLDGSFQCSDAAVLR